MARKKTESLPTTQHPAETADTEAVLKEQIKARSRAKKQNEQPAVDVSPATEDAPTGINTNVAPEVRVDIATGMPIQDETPTGAEKTGNVDGAKVFTQEELNEIISKRLAREREKFEKRIAEIMAQKEAEAKKQSDERHHADAADTASEEKAPAIDLDAIRKELESEMEARLAAMMEEMQKRQREEMKRERARTAIVTTAQRMGLDAELVARILPPDDVPFKPSGQVDEQKLWQKLDELAGKHPSLIVTPGLAGPGRGRGRRGARTDDDRRREYFGAGYADLFSGEGVIIS